MSVCIQYSRPASGKNDSEIFGFDVAVTNFLSAWFRYGAAEQFICRPADLDSFEHFKEIAAQAGVARERCIGLDPRTPQNNLRTISCLFRPDPLTADLVWRRPQVPGRGYATCGLVHTMSGERIVRAVEDLCFAPSDGTDALICPSGSIRKAVLRLWDIYADYLRHRFGGAFACPVLTPVIPLGIDTEKFERLSSLAKRAVQRAALNIGEDETVILFVGRLSFATKAHPLPLLLAADRAARNTGRKLRLIMYGYFKPKDMEPHFRELTADICKKLTVDYIMNDDPRFPDGLWAAADIFTSLSDNVQESFGLTPIEAMAAGLPAVVTDWDGYREGVRNGSEGFLIPTLTPLPEAGMEIARSYYNQGNYGVALSAAAQSTSLDIDHCAQAFTVLMENPELRRGFGASGKARARDMFDWRHVIRAYEALWQEQSEKRAAAALQPPLPENWPAAHPAFPNPWEMFRSFPTGLMTASDIVAIAMNEAEVDLILKHDMNYFVPDLLTPRQTMLELISVIRRARATRIGEILAFFPQPQQDGVWRCLGWMLKHGVCTIKRPAA